MNPPTPPPGLPTAASQLFTLAWDQTASTLTLTLSIWFILALTLVAAALAVWRLWAGGFTFGSFEIDQADLGVGIGKLRFKPNVTDKQVAYAIWVELSTRKIGLPIDFENDVITEIYDSWYTFFSVTRDLVKDIPARRIERDSTQKIIRLSIDVLNEGLRPHLTRWQARFRRWYERELKRNDEGCSSALHDPQKIQENFPDYIELKNDMKLVNERLIVYRRKMHELVMSDR